MSSASSPGESATERVAFLLLGVDCSTCAPVIERSLKRLPGVRGVGTNYIMNTVHVDFDPKRTSPDVVQRRIEDLGYRVVRRPSMAGPFHG